MTRAELYARIRTLPDDMQRQAMQCLAVMAPQLVKQASLPPPPRLSPDEKRLKDACCTNRKLFAETFFPHYCQVPFCSMHEEFFAEADADMGKRGIRRARAAPRSHAKTTIWSTINIIHDICYRSEDYILIVSAIATNSRDRVKGIRDELDNNVRLERIFGKMAGTPWNENDFVTTTGVRVRGASPGTQVRGLLWITPQGAIRPTKVVMDDADHSEHVESEVQREKLYKFVTSDLARLGGGIVRQLNIDAVGTILHPDSLLARLLRNPGYRSKTYRAVISFADNIALWSAWREIYTDLSNEQRLVDALAFFQAHEQEMLEGAEVLWPEWKPYYMLMCGRVQDGDQAFQREDQNDPTSGAAYPFNMETAGYVRVEPDRLVRSDGRVVMLSEIVDVTAFWDPNTGAAEGEPDWSCCVIIARDTNGFRYALDAYVAQHEGLGDQCAHIAEFLYRWRVPKVGLEINSFQSLLVPDLRQAIADVAQEMADYTWTPQFERVTNTRDKVRRIMSLEPLVANRWLWFSDRLHPEFYRQFAEFRPVKDAGHDDCPDAVQGCIMVMEGRIDKRGSQ